MCYAGHLSAGFACLFAGSSTGSNICDFIISFYIFIERFYGKGVSRKSDCSLLGPGSCESEHNLRHIHPHESLSLEFSIFHRKPDLSHPDGCCPHRKDCPQTVPLHRSPQNPFRAELPCRPLPQPPSSTNPSTKPAFPQLAFITFTPAIRSYDLLAAL